MNSNSFHFKSRKGKTIFHTSSVEIKHLVVAWLLISLAYTIARTADSEVAFDPATFIILMLISILTVGIAFILHELAHKVVAQRYKCWAEFRADTTMLAFGVLMSFLGFIFLAPGAVWIYGNIDEKKNGKISMAGPLMNIILATIMLPLLFIKFSNPIVAEIIYSGYYINALIALFNMIPIMNFDGAKIFAWNKKAYFALVIASTFLIFLYYMGTA